MEVYGVVWVVFDVKLKGPADVKSKTTVTFDRSRLVLCNSKPMH